MWSYNHPDIDARQDRNTEVKYEYGIIYLSLCTTIDFKEKVGYPYTCATMHPCLIGKNSGIKESGLGSFYAKRFEQVELIDMYFSPTKIINPP